MTHKNRKSISSSVFIGATTGGMEAFLTNGLNTIKTCNQNKFPIPWSWARSPRTIPDFVKFLYRGGFTNVVGWSYIFGIRLPIRDGVIKYGFQTNNPSFQEETVAAVAAGTVTAIFTSPMELGATLQQTAQYSENNKQNKNIVETYREVIKRFGYQKCLTGFSCVASRDAVVTCGLFTFTPRLKTYLIEKKKFRDLPASGIAGATVGTGCAVSTHFLDTIKSIQQKNVRDGKDKQASSFLQVTKHILQTDGIRGFNRGIFWRTARIAPHVTLISYISEKLTKAWNKFQ